MLFSTERPANSVELLPKSFPFSFPQLVLGDNLIPLTSEDLEKKSFCTMLSDFRTSFSLSSFS